MEKIWKLIRESGITPNQLYLLHSYSKKKRTEGINESLERKNLVMLKYVGDTNLVSPKGKVLLIAANDLFTKTVSAKKPVTDDSFVANLTTYNQLFPKIRFAKTKKLARCSMNNLTPAMVWFLANNDYNWETILKATVIYINEKQKVNWDYCRTSQYFIRKQTDGKHWQSELSDYCMMVMDGTGSQESHTFKEKVF